MKSVTTTLPTNNSAEIKNRWDRKKIIQSAIRVQKAQEKENKWIQKGLND